MANIKRVGYGQVEPNHLSAQRTGQIYAQLPAAAALGDKIENGQFVKYDLANNECHLTGKGEWMLVFNEIKLYDDRKQMYRDYAMLKEDCVNGVMVPRVFKINIGDIYTTNMIAEIDPAVGSLLKVGNNGILTTGAESDVPCFQVAKRYTLADGQDAVKVVRIK